MAELWNSRCPVSVSMSMNLRDSCLVAVFLAVACREKPTASDAPVKPSQAAQKAPKGADADAVKSAPVSAPEAQELRKLLEEWKLSQNEADHARYSKLYAEDFRGIKRAGEQSQEMERAEWLDDRKQLLLRTPRVEVSTPRFYRKAGTVLAEFRQTWSTQNFADEGTKLLTLRKRGDSWEIVREVMLTSRPLSAEERSQAPETTGHCERLRKALEDEKHPAERWRFADMGEEMRTGWVAVKTWEDAERAQPDIYLSATVVFDAEWAVAYTTHFSPSGDSSVWTEHCYRPDGSLAKLIDTYRTFNTGEGLGEDVKVTVFDASGRAGWTSRQTRLLESGKPLAPTEMMGQAESKPHMRISDLPYFGLLPPKVRERY